MVDEPHIFVPGWVQSTSGLLVPGSVARLPKDLSLLGGRQSRAVSALEGDQAAGEL